MSENSSIEWTDHTFNTHWGCHEISPGCDNCYARTLAARFGTPWGVDAPRREFGDKHWNEPLKWDRKAAAAGVRVRVFSNSMSDLFDKNAPAGVRERWFALTKATPNIDWLALTKRIGNVASMLPDDWGGGYPNVWLGATVVNQPEYDRDIGKLLRTPAARHFLSIEPMLGAIDMRMGGASMPDYAEHRPLPRLDWVICGGESDRKARPMHPDWAHSLRNQCEAAGVPFMFKQWGEWMPESAMTLAQRMRDCGQFECLFTKLDGSTHWIDPEDHTPFDASDVRMVKVGKKTAGRLLDGRTHDGFPA